MVVPMDSTILEDKELMMMHVDLQTRFPIYHVCSKCMAALLCGAADTKEGLNNPSGIGCAGKDTGRLVTWEFPLRTDSASWKSLESFIQFTSFCSSCTLLDNSKIVFWVFDELSSCERIECRTLEFS